MAKPLVVEEVQSLEVLQDLAARWNELVDHRPMRSTRWLLQWWSVFGDADDSKRLRVLLVRSGDELVGIAPFYETRTGSHRVLRLLGDAGDICTDHTTCFAQPEFESAVGNAVVSRFAATKDWTRFQLETCDTTEPVMKQVLAGLDERGFLSHQRATLNCWALKIPDTWDEYLDVLSKSHRKRCRRLVRGYFDNGRVAVHEANGDNFEDVWRVFLNLHALRWGGGRRPDGSFTNRRFRDFHEGVSRQLLEAGQLRLCYLSCDEQPIAAEYQFIDNDTLYAYQSGMAPDMNEVQPGNLSLIATIKFCIDRGLNKLDLLRGDEPYKAHWRATPSARKDIRVWPQGITGKMEQGFFNAKTWASALFKRADS